jgi:hypothetical protein
LLFLLSALRAGTQIQFSYGPADIDPSADDTTVDRACGRGPLATDMATDTATKMEQSKRRGLVAAAHGEAVVK